MTNKVGIVIVYFGKFKPSIALFLESCKRNPEIDWFIFTDNKAPEDLGGNIRWINSSLEEFEKMAIDNLHKKVHISRPYKLCDLKPIYGEICQEYLKEYSYFGYGDVDVIYGRIMPYLIAHNFELYDKVNIFGHLSLIKNNDDIRTLWRKNIQGTIDADKVISYEGCLGFDEFDINEKFIASGMKVFNGIIGADIDYIYKRMRLADNKTLEKMSNFKIDKNKKIKNYKYQLFVVESSRVYRIFLQKKQVKKDEFAYIHFRREAPIFMDDTKSDCFVVSREGFFNVNSDMLEDYKYVRELISKYNRRKSGVEEELSYILNYLITNNKIVNRLYWKYRKIKYGSDWHYGK